MSDANPSTSRSKATAFEPEPPQISPNPVQLIPGTQRAHHLTTPLASPPSSTSVGMYPSHAPPPSSQLPRLPPPPPGAAISAALPSTGTGYPYEARFQHPQVSTTVPQEPHLPGMSIAAPPGAVHGALWHPLVLQSHSAGPITSFQAPFPQEPVRNRKVFLSDLPSTAERTELAHMFRMAGNVLDVFVDHEKLTGTVLFSRPEEAAYTIEYFNRTIYRGSVLKISTVPLVSGTDLWIGNLPFWTTWRDLRSFLQAQGFTGLKRVDIAEDYHTHQSRGYAIVSFHSREEAATCAKRMNGMVFQGRTLTVREDREAGQEVLPVRQVVPQQLYSVAESAGRTVPLETEVPEKELDTATQPAAPESTTDKSSPSKEPSAPSRLAAATLAAGQQAGSALYVGNIFYGARWQDLKDLFRNAGRVLRADIMAFPGGRSKGHGIVVMASDEEAERAKSIYNGFDFCGRDLLVTSYGRRHQHCNRRGGARSRASSGRLSLGPVISSSSTRIRIDNLPENVDVDELSSLLRQANIQVSSVNIQDSKCAIVKVKSFLDAQRGLEEFTQYNLHGKHLFVSYDIGPEDTNSRSTSESAAGSGSQSRSSRSVKTMTMLSWRPRRSPATKQTATSLD